MKYKYPAINVAKKDGSEILSSENTKLATLHDFWAWAHSDLCSNAERGKFAEYLISLAMKCADGVSDEWGAYDVLSPEGIKIEVKTSAYIQTWAQKELSKLLFSIRASHGWDSEAGQYDEEYKRQADIYVFCVETCKSTEQLDPLNLSQWDFYPIATSTLNEAVGSQKTITLVALIKLGAKPVKYPQLREAIISIAHTNSAK